MGLSLYEITEKYKGIFRSIEETGELNEGQAFELTALEGSFNEKCVNIAAYIKNMECEKQAIKDVIDRLKTKEAKVSSSIEQLEKYMKNGMETLSIAKIDDSPLFTISIKNNPPKVVIIDESDISNSYFKHKTIIEIDKASIREDLLDGLEVSGAKLESTTRLEIK